MSVPISVPERRLTVAGVDTHLYDAGSGEVPVVCVHGNPDSGESWLSLLSRSAQLGRVIAPDLPGWGRSERPDRRVFDGSLDAHDRWFEALLDALELDRFRLVVHDWGALALSAASRRAAQVQRLVIIDPVPLSGAYRWHWIGRLVWRPPVIGEISMPPFNGTTIKLLTRLQRPGLRALPQEWIDQVDSHLDAGMKDAILRLYRSADPDVLARHGSRLGELTCPTLLMWGENDPYVPIRYMAVMREALGSTPEEWVIPGGGHWPMLETPEVDERTAEFLAR
ncbi:MAG TPA: alpha/beta hydrolase [Solirubrobacteraceae bacterium]|nr:alpha/beta hydrolase [Solirubrobacteraceae bacterium]